MFHEHGNGFVFLGLIEYRLGRLTHDVSVLTSMRPIMGSLGIMARLLVLGV